MPVCAPRTSRERNRLSATHCSLSTDWCPHLPGINDLVVLRRRMHARGPPKLPKRNTGGASTCSWRMLRSQLLPAARRLASSTTSTAQALRLIRKAFEVNRRRAVSNAAQHLKAWLWSRRHLGNHLLGPAKPSQLQSRCRASHHALEPKQDAIRRFLISEEAGPWHSRHRRWRAFVLSLYVRTHTVQDKCG